VLVDDIADYRALVRVALRAHGGFDVVAEADDGASAIEAVARLQPDVVVLDLGLPDLPGAEVISRLRTASARTGVVVFSGTELSDAHELRGQVEAYVRKDNDVELLVALLAEVASSAFRFRFAVRLAEDPRSSSAARRIVREKCVEWDCEQVMEPALLVATELVTNAVTHGRSECDFRLFRTGARLRIEAEDRGSGSPDIRESTAGDEHGRGLLLVSALSSAWGVESVPPGRKRVWADLLVPSASAV
jgi:CheY-like chemotaxis protein